jgi:hypothetical protein
MHRFFKYLRKQLLLTELFRFIYLIMEGMKLMNKTLEDIKADVAQLRSDIAATLSTLSGNVATLTEQVGILKAQIANGGSVSQQDLNDLAAQLESMDETVKAAVPAPTPTPTPTDAPTPTPTPTPEQ